MAETIETKYEDLSPEEREVGALRQRIVMQEERISSHIGEFSQKIKQSLDWRQYVTNYPYASIGLAAGIGLLASSWLLPKPPTTMEKVSEIVSEAAGTQVGDFISSRRRKTIMSSLMGLAMTMGAALAKRALTQALMGEKHSPSPRRAYNVQPEPASRQATMQYK